jgi:helix-turn-helix protein
MMNSEKIVAQARAYYIIGFGRDSTIYDDKKWVIGKIYFTGSRIVFKKFDRINTIEYRDIIEIEEKDKYYRVSPPTGWSRGSILEIKHYELGRAHVLTSLISGEFDVVTTMRGIISKFAMHSEQHLSKNHRKTLLLISMGIRDKQAMAYLTDSAPTIFSKIIDELKLAGLISENLILTAEGRKIVSDLRKDMNARENVK